MSETKSRPNLYLMGFMGTGKSAIGRILAQRLKMQYLDADNEIERDAGKPITEIFAERGEAYFRELELQFIETGHPDDNCIISCGGGMVTVSNAVEKLQQKGIIFSLFASPETIHERTRHNSHRPLLNVEDPLQRIAELLSKRDPLYRNAGINITTDNRSVQEVAQHIERVYNDQLKKES